ncbi:hypothetical protein C8R47DRAFT_1224811 [Mycena vitilis]|nr:hypothetical protein C8R47DRAFT_1224811 [Mycena vitilis]
MSSMFVHSRFIDSTFVWCLVQFVRTIPDVQAPLSLVGFEGKNMQVTWLEAYISRWISSRGDRSPARLAIPDDLDWLSQRRNYLQVFNLKRLLAALFLTQAVVRCISLRQHTQLVFNVALRPCPNLRTNITIHRVSNSDSTFPRRIKSDAVFGHVDFPSRIFSTSTQIVFNDSYCGRKLDATPRNAISRARVDARDTCSPNVNTRLQVALRMRIADSAATSSAHTLLIGFDAHALRVLLQAQRSRSRTVRTHHRHRPARAHRETRAAIRQAADAECGASGPMLRAWEARRAPARTHRAQRTLGVELPAPATRQRSAREPPACCARLVCSRTELAVALARITARSASWAAHLRLRTRSNGETRAQVQFKAARTHDTTYWRRGRGRGHDSIRTPKG